MIKRSIQVLAAFIAISSSAIAQEEDRGLDEEFELLLEEDVVFTAAKHEQDIEDSPSAITVITREQIENTYCTNVTCLLSQVPEMDVRKDNPMYTTVGSRALTVAPGDKVLALVDGREINIEIFGVPFWETLPVHMEDIERIEVIRGPGSALYGANAYSAVFSIITKKTTSNMTEAFIGGGEVNATNLYLKRDQMLGDWRLHLSASHETNNSWESPQLREREVNRFRMRLDRETSNSTSTLEAGLVLPAGLIQMDIIPIWLRNSCLASTLLSHQTGPWRARLWFEYLQIDMSADMPIFYQGIKLGEYPDPMRTRSTTLDADLQAHWNPMKGNLLTTGATYRWITYQSPENNPEEIFQHRLGFFLQDEQRLGGNLTLTAGVRLDYNNITPFAVSPRLAGVWKMNQNQTLRLAVSRAFRKPALFNTSLHTTKIKSDIQGIDQFLENGMGNVNLKNESITTAEAGYLGYFLNDQLVVEGDIFFNVYRDNIHLVSHIELNVLGFPDLNKSFIQYRNSGLDVNSIGGSISITYRIHKALRLNANYTHRYSFYASSPPQDSGILEGKKFDRVMWESPFLFNFTCHYLPEKGLRYGMGLHGVSASDGFESTDGSMFSQRVAKHFPLTLNISAFASWRFLFSLSQWEIGVRASNLVFHPIHAVERADNKIIGKELIGRLIFVYLNTSW